MQIVSRNQDTELDSGNYGIIIFDILPGSKIRILFVVLPSGLC